MEACFPLHLSWSALKWPSDARTFPDITHHWRAGQLPEGVLAGRFSWPWDPPVFIMGGSISVD